MHNSHANPLSPYPHPFTLISPIDSLQAVFVRLLGPTAPLLLDGTALCIIFSSLQTQHLLKMGFRNLSLASIGLLLIRASICGSFYDNPEQDVFPPKDTKEELHNKWDFEVNLSSTSNCFCR